MGISLGRCRRTEDIAIGAAEAYEGGGGRDTVSSGGLVQEALARCAQPGPARPGEGVGRASSARWRVGIVRQETRMTLEELHGRTTAR